MRSSELRVRSDELGVKNVVYVRECIDEILCGTLMKNQACS
jgi:hypothetical protein